MAENRDNDVRKKWADETKYVGESPSTSGHVLQPSDHFKTDGSGKPVETQSNFIGNLKDQTHGSEG